MRSAIRFGVCFVLVLAGCASPPGAPPRASGDAKPANRTPEAQSPSIAGRWIVLSLEVDGVQLKPPASSEPIALEFSSNDIASPRVSGFAGVNRFSGTYSFSLGEMNVGGLWVKNITATRRGGPEPLMDFETNLLRVLEGARTFSFDGNRGSVDSGEDRIRLTR